MKKYAIDLFIYRWRYVIGYTTLALTLALAIVTAAIYTPGGLTQAEISAIQPVSSAVINTPPTSNLLFHSLQILSFSLFGLSIITIKLPAIIISITTSVAIFFLLRRWFKPNVAILSMLIMAATGQYIFIAQHATPGVLYVLYSTLILLFSSLILQKAKYRLLWKISLGVSVGLSLYTPFFLYINVGLLIVALIHPHTRYHLLRKSERVSWGIAMAAFGVTLAPLVYACLQQPELVHNLLGITNLPPIDIVTNIKTLLMTYFWITPVVVNGQIAPIMDFSALALAILGIIILFRQHHSARSYTIAAWVILTSPLLLIDPYLTVLVTTPMIILLAIGLETLLHEWYKLFPKNPYARGTGLVLTIGLVGIMVMSGIDRFMNGYQYMPLAARGFNADVSLITQQIKQRPVRTLLLVDERELSLYRTLVHYNFSQLDIRVDSTPPPDDTGGNAIATRAARDSAPAEWTLQSIITNERYENGDRLYLYKTSKDALQ